jgi:RNA polymerase sigma factor (sigma-70 family)
MSVVEADRRLTQQAIQGDDGAFAAIFDRYHQRLYRYCLAIVGNTQDAQDALQNTMVKVLRALPGEGRQIELKPWLYRIAHNESIELLRRRRDIRRLDAELAAPGLEPAEEVASRERLRRLISDLDELPERQRGALVMRELAGLDYAEIGTALGTSSAVARQTLYEARLSLRGMDEGRAMSCAAVTRALSDGDGRVTRRRDLRAHLRSCAGCRRFRAGIEARELDLVALSPLPPAVAAGMLERLLGGSAAAGGAAGALGGGAAKSAGSAAVLKGVTTLAVVAAVGAGAAYQGGLTGSGEADPGHPRSTRVHLQHEGAHLVRAATGLRPPGASVRRPGSQLRDTGQAEATGALAPDPGSATGPTEGDAVPTAGEVASPEDGKAEAVSAPVSGSESGSAEHPNGRGHEKALPGAAEHGQQTASEHKASEHGPQTAAEHGSSEHGRQTAAEHKAAEHGSPGAGGEGQPAPPPAGDPAPEAGSPPEAPPRPPVAEEAHPAHGAGGRPDPRGL